MEIWQEAVERAIYIQTPEEFRRAWEEACEEAWEYREQLRLEFRPMNLVAIERGSFANRTLNRFHIPPSTKEFLIESGLPANSVFRFHFDRLHKGVFTLQELLPEDATVPEDLSEYIEIGSCSSLYMGWDGSFICIEEFTGRILAVTASEDGVEKRFVNKDVLSLAKSILVVFWQRDIQWSNFSWSNGRYGHDFSFVVGEECKELISFLDPDAIDDGESFWCRRFAEMAEDDF
jgi:hypothetical protein